MTNDAYVKKVTDIWISLFKKKSNLSKTDLNILEECLEAIIMTTCEWKDKEFWSLDNVEKIIVTYNSFPDRSCPHEMVRKTIEKLKPENTK